MSSMDRPVTRSVYVVVLRKDSPSPLAPESDEEKGRGSEEGQPRRRPRREGQAARKRSKEVEPVVASTSTASASASWPCPSRRATTSGLAAGKAGDALPARRAAGGSGRPARGRHPAQVRPENAQVGEDDRRHPRRSSSPPTARRSCSAQGAQWVDRGRRRAAQAGRGRAEDSTAWRSASIRAPSGGRCTARSGASSATSSTTPTCTALDLKAAEREIRAVPRRRRQPRGSELPLRGDARRAYRCGHLFVSGGAMPEVKRVRGGLLGADYRIENGRYRFARVYNGENWNPQLRAPLTQPGVNVKAGEYLLAVNGREVARSDNVYSFFEADRRQAAVLLKVGPDPGRRQDAREVTVVPVANEFGAAQPGLDRGQPPQGRPAERRAAGLRLPAGHRRRRLHQLQPLLLRAGRQAGRGHRRALQRRRQRRRLHHRLHAPPAHELSSPRATATDFTTPVGSIFGPKVMIINEYAGSGGDMMPWLFRKTGIGPLVGKRTWGGLVGISGFPA